MFSMLYRRLVMSKNSSLIRCLLFRRYRHDGTPDDFRDFRDDGVAESFDAAHSIGYPIINSTNEG